MRFILLVLATTLAACTPSGESDAPSPEATPRPTRVTPSTPLSDAEQQRLDHRLLDAAWANDVDRARTLIGDGADVNWQDQTQQSAYLVATSEGYLDLLELTLRSGARVNDKDSFNGTGLIRAAERGHASIVGRLVQAGISLDHVNRLGWTALHEAVILGDGSERYVETVRVLLAAGVDVDVPAERDGLTALQHAEAKGQDEIATLLRRATGPAVAEPGVALLRAADAGDADAVALALRGGAELETRDDRRRTPCFSP